MSRPHSALSGSGAIANANMLGLMDSLLSIRSPDDFLKWTRGPLQEVVPHDMFIGGIAQIDASRYRIHKVLTYRWPAEYFDRLRQPDGSVYSPVLQRWAGSQEPQLFAPRSCPQVDDPTWLAVFRDAGLRNIASHGLREIAGSLSSYVNFSRVLVPLDGRITRFLELLMPHIHVALIRIMSEMPLLRPAQPTGLAALTPSQCDVLKWMVEGKTNWEIAKVLGRSEHTVKHHVAEILRKLGVRNRAQAVARALGSGFFS